MGIVKRETLCEIVCGLYRDEPEFANRLCGMSNYFITRDIEAKYKELTGKYGSIKEMLAYVRQT